MKTWRWEDPIYGARVELMLGGSGAEFLKRLQRQAKCDPYTDEELKTAEANKASVSPYRAADDGPLHVAIWFGPHVDINSVDGVATIVHETLHAAMHVFRDRQIPIGFKTEEPLAYYQMYLFMEIIKRFAPRRIRVTKKRR